MANAWSHPDDLHCRPVSSGWHNVIWIISRPDELGHSRISSVWLMDIAVCHPDDLRYCPMSSAWHDVIWTIKHPDELASSRISSECYMSNAVCHPDHLRYCPISSGWHLIWSISHPHELAPDSISSRWRSMQDDIWMTYDVVLCHPDGITKFKPYVIRIS